MSSMKLIINSQGRRTKLFVAFSLVSIGLLMLMITGQADVMREESLRLMDNIQHKTNNLDPDSISRRLIKLEESDHEKKHLLDLIFCRILQALPSGGFCLNSKSIFSGGNEYWDGKLCKALEDLFGYSSVGDFGAGLGHYGRCFLRRQDNLIQHENRVEQLRLSTNYKSQMRKAGILDTPQVIRSWEGWDGAVNIELLSDGLIKSIDLADPVDLKQRFDWVMSIEVGEHIPAKGEDAFVDNLVRHACKGIVLSWAVPGQGGHVHVNTRSNDYVKSKMAERGLVSDEEAQDKIRKQVDISWFKDTIMVFRFPEARC